MNFKNKEYYKKKVIEVLSTIVSAVCFVILVAILFIAA